MGISPEVIAYSEKILKNLESRFKEIDEIAEINQLKVLQALQKAKVSEAHLLGSTGYGYNDIGRDALEEVYANYFHTEDALVRSQIVCGTHALAIALQGNLRPGDEILSPVGKPYDTLDEVIGIRDSLGSLKEFGVSYKEVALLPDGSFDYEGIKNAISEKTRLVEIQRSKGYSDRKSFSPKEIGDLIRFIKGCKKDLICMVDNCYGEFVCTEEPSDYGADMVVGSLIKNPGGGLAPIGGYIAGSKECIERAAVRLTAPGLGKELGPSLHCNKDFFQGFFLAPTVTASAEKSAIFAASLFESLGYIKYTDINSTTSAEKSAIFAASLFESLGFPCHPKADSPRNDIIQEIRMGNGEALLAFCRGIQEASPVDSFVRPEPWDMPGYEDPVVMAAGAFISGSSIELSADAPLREPYSVYFQGGLTFAHGKFGVIKALDNIFKAGLVKIPKE